MPANQPVAASLTTPDGYMPPPASRGLVKGVPFDKASRVGQKYTDRFGRWDMREQQKPENKRDENKCKGLYRLPGNVLFWEAKMAIDSDGSTTDSVKKSDPDWGPGTSYHFSDGTGVNAEIVPYFVVPTYDNPAEDPKRTDFERSGDNFVTDLGLRHGNLGVVIFGNLITGAIFADEGPPMKIGEAAIRVHELIRRPPAPWKGDPANKILSDSGEDHGVLYFVFTDQTFNIDTFGAARQTEMADSIQNAAKKLFDILYGNPVLPVA
jgi:glycosyl hydrolase group 75 (putative chitosanase)